MQNSKMESGASLRFDEFLGLLRQHWRQGQHVAIIGPTGRGKTTLASHILGLRGWVVVVAVKRHDDTLNLFKRRGYPIIKKWPPPSGTTHLILWIKPKSIDDTAEQEYRVHEALSTLYIEGAWCVYLDEVGYLAGFLGQSKPIGVLLNQGRSSNISMVCSMTRPRSAVASIPIETISMCRHVILFKYTDSREIEVCSKIVGIGLKEMVQYMKDLQEHEFLYCREGTIVKVEAVNAHTH